MGVDVFGGMFLEMCVHLFLEDVPECFRGRSTQGVYKGCRRRGLDLFIRDSACVCMSFS